MSLSVPSRPNPSVVPALLRHAPSLGVLALIVALFAMVGGSLTMPGAAVPGAADPALRQASLEAALPKPESDPTALAPLTAADAIARNAALPVEAGPNPAAAAFHLPADQIARMRSIDCLTAAVYYEAGLEPLQGQRAVAQVVLNRVRHPAYPNTVCGVVFQGSQRLTGCQFTFTCDGALRRTPVPALWERARHVAEAALGGYVERSVGLATHYHANYVFPYWAPTLAKITQIGAHIFYRWDGGMGRPGAFTSRYAGAEPNIQWRGGFGQPDRQLAAATTAEDREAAAAAAAAEAERNAPQQSVDSFQRAVLRRYEPVNSENAQQIIERRLPGQTATSTSSRWTLTGQTSGEAQRPLGRSDLPPVLDGVRRAPSRAAAPAPAAPTASANSAEAR